MKINPGSDVDHDFLATYIGHMKGVYQRALDAYSESGPMRAGELAKIRNHLRALAMLQKTISEHHEMACGAAYDAGSISLGLHTAAVLIKPNGEVIQISRKKG